jgi:hypothetical protein
MEIFKPWKTHTLTLGSISMKAAKLEIGVWKQETGGRRQKERGRRKEPEQVFLQI